MDNVVEAEFVLPDGRIVYLRQPLPEAELEGLDADALAAEKEQHELWWMFRGAGLAFGVLTSVRCKAFRVPLVYSGNLIWPFNPATAPSLIKHWRDVFKSAPRELTTHLVLTAGPNEQSHVVVIGMCYIGPRSMGDQYLSALLAWEGEHVLLKDVEMRTFLTHQENVVHILKAQEGNRWCIRANLMDSLPDEAVHQTVLRFRNMPERSAWLFEIAGGAVADVEPGSSCFPLALRQAPYHVAAIHQWRTAQEDSVWQDAACKFVEAVCAPHAPQGLRSTYPCFLARGEGRAKVEATFGPDNWQRLVEVKERLDPQGVMRHCFWPSDDPVEEPSTGAALDGRA